IFSSSSYSVNENAGVATITVVNAGGLPGSIDYSTSDGTAVAGLDYVPVSPPATLVFAAGQTTATFSIGIEDNAVVNPNKTINLILSNPQGAARLGCLSTAVLTIIDDETLSRPNVAGEFVFSTFLN